MNMKLLSLALSTILLCTNYQANACGPFSPYGEYLRFSLVPAETWDDEGYQPFCYSADYFFDSWGTDFGKSCIMAGNEMNIDQYLSELPESITRDEVHAAVYGALNLDDLNSGNRLVAFLNSAAGKDLKAYIQFAKSCSSLNNMESDPWERDSDQLDALRREKAKIAEKRASRLEGTLRRRYAFLAIRLYFYSGNQSRIHELYEKYFSNSFPHDIIHYWALYFECLDWKDPIKRNIALSKVFEHAPDKRVAVHFNYDRKIALSQVLSGCNSDSEKASVLLFSAAIHDGPSLDLLKQFVEVSNNKNALDFLLIRELNKLEDWVYTPFYTSYNPAVANPADSSNSWFEVNRASMERDRRYTGKFLDFVLKLKHSSEKGSFIPILLADLYLIMNNPENALKVLSALPEAENVSGVSILIDRLKGISKLKMASSGIPEFTRQIMMKDTSGSSRRFLFICARELEFRGESSLAAMLLSHVSPSEEEHWDYWNLGNAVFYRSPTGKSNNFTDYFSEYFWYLDVEYSASQMETLIDDIIRYGDSDFEQWLTYHVNQDIPRLYDLLGTKYMRTDHIDMAIRSFRRVNDSIWTSASFPYKEYLDANPFYTNFYQEHAPSKADSTTYNKLEIAEKIRRIKILAEDPMEANRDFYYFLLGNAYLNMTQYGNSWIMKRYYWSGHVSRTGMPDDDDYFMAIRARHYYEKAAKLSADREFAALALRMAGRCEKYELQFKWDEERWKSNNWVTESSEEYQNRLFASNNNYRKLQAVYPEVASKLLSNCFSFDRIYHQHILREGLREP